MTDGINKDLATANISVTTATSRRRRLNYHTELVLSCIEPPLLARSTVWPRVT